MLPDIRGANADLYVIGSGDAAQAREFREKSGLDATFLVDPDLESFRRANLKRAVWRTMNPASLLFMVRTRLRGVKGGRIQGDIYQQGGALVVARGGSVVLHHAAQVAGEALPVGEIVAAAKGAAAG